MVAMKRGSFPMPLRCTQMLVGLCVGARDSLMRGGLGVVTGGRSLVLRSGALGVLGRSARHEQPVDGHTGDETTTTASHGSSIAAWPFTPDADFAMSSEIVATLATPLGILGGWHTARCVERHRNSTNLCTTPRARHPLRRATLARVHVLRARSLRTALQVPHIS
jgi:hypothetical protein